MPNVVLIFLEATDEVLARRYSETRRPHPLAADLPIIEAIQSERAALTKRLEALRAPPGFTGRAPGGPSRWSTERSGEWEPVRPELVVEVRFDNVTGDRFRHGTKLLRWRPDKKPRQCTFETVHPVTQWKVVVCETAGRARTSGHVSVTGLRTWPVISSR